MTYIYNGMGILTTSFTHRHINISKFQLIIRAILYLFQNTVVQFRSSSTRKLNSSPNISHLDRSSRLARPPEPPTPPNRASLEKRTKLAAALNAIRVRACKLIFVGADTLAAATACGANTRGGIIINSHNYNSRACLIQLG